MITEKLFNSIFPVAGLSLRKYNLVRERVRLIAALNKFLPKYGITTFLRVVAFLACCGIETDYFKTTEEYASGADYDTRTDLGNTPQRDGDGQKYKGSGLIQTTGFYNFFRVLIRFVKKLTGVDYSNNKIRAFAEADRLGVNFIKHPELLRDNIEIAVEAACIFWEENNLNHYADLGQFKELNGIVNRGDKRKMPIQWAKRNELYSLLKRRIPADFSFAPVSDINVARSNNPAPVVLTPTGIPLTPATMTDTTSTAAPPTGEAAPPASLKEIGTTVFLHTPRDTVKNIALVIGTRIFAGVSTVWYLGLHGQIFLIAVSVITAAAIVYACIRYAPRLLSWSEKAVDYFTGNTNE